MSDSNQHFSEFKPHSKHKHLILREYFLAWGHKLGLRIGAGDKILYVDACAGRGRDDVGNHGSPLIAAVAAAVAQESVSERRSTPFEIHVVAIEANRAYVKELSALLSPFGDNVRVVHGTLAELAFDLETQYPKTPRLTFIDPFGLDPLKADVVREALRGDRSEALLLFADQAALRHFGAIAAEETRAERRHREAADPLPLFPGLEPSGLSELAKAATVSRGALEMTRANAMRIMTTAFGDNSWYQQIESASPDDRRRRLIDLYSSRLRSWGAMYTLRVPIVDSSGTHAYTLIHASRQAKAYRTMKEAVTYALRHSPLPADVVEEMRYLVRSDLAAAEGAIRREFGGRTVRWAEDPKDASAECVRNFALENTEAYPFEFDELKERLRSSKLPGQSIVYAFPPE